MKLLLIVNGTPIEREYADDLPIHAVKLDAITKRCSLLTLTLWRAMIASGILANVVYAAALINRSLNQAGQ